VYNSDDVYKLIDELDLGREVNKLRADIKYLTSMVDSYRSVSKEELKDFERSLSDRFDEKDESDRGDVSGVEQTIEQALESISETLNEVLLVVNRPGEESIIWPPTMGQVVTLQGWDYPHVVKAVEIDGGVVKYLVGASTRRVDDKDVLVRLSELVPHKW